MNTICEVIAAAIEREDFRRKVLAALDTIAEECGYGEQVGWQDQELPELFRALDKICDRLGVQP